jgi:flagellar hook-associated protein 2
MATITSPGIGSGLDVSSIVSQLVAIERAPVTLLQTQATATQTKLSTYGTIQSQVSTLQDAAAKLGGSSSWDSVSASSSNSTAVSVTASEGAAVSGITVEVQNLAKSQSTASATFAAGASVGTGSMTIELGQWSGGAFTAQSGGSPVSITIESGEDSLSEIAAKINAADAGVTATVLSDANGERLLMRSNDTGEVNGFRVQVSDDDGNNGDAGGLSSLSFDPDPSPAPGAFNGATLTQGAENALATINNVAIVSASNKLDGNLPNVKLTLSQVTTAPVEIKISSDTATIKKNIQAFVDAYNTLSSTLSTSTAYNADSESAGILQGDSTAVGLQNALRSMMRSMTAGSSFQSLSQIGIETQTGGTLSINADKLDTAFSDLSGLKEFFTTDTGSATTQGFGLKVEAFTEGLLDTDGLISNKSAALTSSIERNGVEQEKVNDRADRFEVRLLAQYNAMDANVAKFNARHTYITQQIELWNQSSS